MAVVCPPSARRSCHFASATGVDWPACSRSDLMRCLGASICLGCGLALEPLRRCDQMTGRPRSFVGCEGPRTGLRVCEDDCKGVDQAGRTGLAWVTRYSVQDCGMTKLAGSTSGWSIVPGEPLVQERRSNLVGKDWEGWTMAEVCALGQTTFGQCSYRDLSHSNWCCCAMEGDS